MSVIANSSLVESSPSSGQNTALIKLKERMNVFVQELERARAEVNQKNGMIEEEIQKKNAVITLTVIPITHFLNFLFYKRMHCVQAEAELAALRRRMQLIEEDREQTERRLQEVTQKLEEASKAAEEAERCAMYYLLKFYSLYACIFVFVCICFGSSWNCECCESYCMKQYEQFKKSA